MGKIIRNGIEYGGTYDSATSVNYDNSVSGLNARTVQEGIDELNESLTHLIKSKTMSITTDNNAVSAIGLNKANTVPVCVDVAGMTAYIGTTYNNLWHVMLCDYGTGQAKKNTTASITVYYLEFAN